MMTPGRLYSQGILFLRKGLYTAVRPDGSFALCLQLTERWRTPGAPADSVRRVDAWWHGPAAESFYRAWQHLRPGAALHVALEDVHAISTADNSVQLAATVYACSIAPARWPAANDAPPPPAQAAVDVFEPALLPAQFMRQPEPPLPAPDKTAIKDALKAGQDVPGARLATTNRLEIK